MHRRNAGSTHPCAALFATTDQRSSPLSYHVLTLQWHAVHNLHMSWHLGCVSSVSSRRRPRALPNKYAARSCPYHSVSGHTAPAVRTSRLASAVATWPPPPPLPPPPSLSPPQPWPFSPPLLLAPAPPPRGSARTGICDNPSTLFSQYFLG